MTVLLLLLFQFLQNSLMIRSFTPDKRSVFSVLKPTSSTSLDRALARAFVVFLFKLSHSAPKNVGQSHRIVCHCEIQKEVQKSRMRDFWMALHSQGHFSSFLRRFDMKHEKLLYTPIFPISSYSFKEDWMLVLSQVLWNVGVHFILL